MRAVCRCCRCCNSRSTASTAACSEAAGAGAGASGAGSGVVDGAGVGAGSGVVDGAGAFATGTVATRPGSVFTTGAPGRRCRADGTSGSGRLAKKECLELLAGAGANGAAAEEGAGRAAGTCLSLEFHFGGEIESVNHDTVISQGAPVMPCTRGTHLDCRSRGRQNEGSPSISGRTNCSGALAWQQCCSDMQRRPHMAGCTEYMCHQQRPLRPLDCRSCCCC